MLIFVMSLIHVAHHITLEMVKRAARFSLNYCLYLCMTTVVAVLLDRKCWHGHRIGAVFPFPGGRGRASGHFPVHRPSNG